MNEDTFIYETRYLCTGHGRCNILLLCVLTYSSSVSLSFSLARTLFSSLCPLALTVASPPLASTVSSHRHYCVALRIDVYNSAGIVRSSRRDKRDIATLARRATSSAKSPEIPATGGSIFNIPAAQAALGVVRARPRRICNFDSNIDVEEDSLLCTLVPRSRRKQRATLFS